MAENYVLFPPSPVPSHFNQIMQTENGTKRTEVNL